LSLNNKIIFLDKIFLQLNNFEKQFSLNESKLLKINDLKLIIDSKINSINEEKTTPNINEASNNKTYSYIAPN
jgi:hypothetical protein